MKVCMNFIYDLERCNLYAGSDCGLFIDPIKNVLVHSPVTQFLKLRFQILRAIRDVDDDATSDGNERRRGPTMICWSCNMVRSTSAVSYPEASARCNLQDFFKRASEGTNRFLEYGDLLVVQYGTSAVSYPEASARCNLKDLFKRASEGTNQ
jgi:hypothetical protein